MDEPAAEGAPQQRECGCLRCVRQRDEGKSVGGIWLPAEFFTFIACNVCGNKRCPHSDDHRNPCTNSNEPGQPGSRYPKPSWK